MAKQTEVAGVDANGTLRTLRADANGGQMGTTYAREAMCTGYATTLDNYGVALLPASTGSYTDLLMVTASTTSTTAVSCDLKTGTTTIMRFVIPAASSVTLPFSYAIPAYERSCRWTVGLALAGNATGTVVTVYAVGIKNVN